MGLSNDKIYNVKEDVIYCYKLALCDTVLLIVRENLVCGRVLLLKEAVIDDKVT